MQGVTKQAVQQAISKDIKSLLPEDIDTTEYQTLLSRKLYGKHAKIIDSIDEEVINKAGLGERANAAKNLLADARVAMGRPSSITGIGIALSPDMQAAVDRIIARSPVDNSQVIDIESNPLIESET